MTTLTVASAAPTHTGTATELDTLIPPPLRPAKKLAVALLLVVATIALVVVANQGYLYPSAFDADDRVSMQLGYANRDEGIFSVRVDFTNDSSRVVRLTDVQIDTPGAELVRVGLLPPALQERGPTLRVPDEIIDPEAGSDLPANIEPVNHDFIDNEYSLILWLRPTSCLTRGSSWGSLAMTVDFGESGLPPWSSTTEFNRPLWPVGPSNDRTININESQGAVFGDGPLEAACEALQ